jgi:hypothetical protein
VTRLPESDFRAVLEFLREADAVEGPDPFPVSLLESLRRLVPPITPRTTSSTATDVRSSPWS